MSDGANGDSDHTHGVSNAQQVTEAHRDLANEALLEFDNKNYSACLQVLSKLSGLRNSDPHVLHNKAVTEFFASDCKSIEQLRKTLNQICYMRHSTPDNAKNLDDVDQACVYYNKAVVLHFLGQHHSALSIVNNLFSIIDSMDEELAERVMFLLVELNICCYKPEKALELLPYIEKSLSGNSACKPSESTESQDDKDSTDDSLSAMWKCRISQYKMRCCLMMKSFKLCKREMKSLTNSSNPCSTIVFNYLKSNFEYLRGNYRKAMKILLSTPQSPALTDMGSYIPVMYFNNLSCVHFVIGKPNLATFYLKKALVENEKIMKEITGENKDKDQSMFTMSINCYYSLIYNLGIQLLHSNKPLVAFECLLQAVQVYQNNPRLWLRLAECCIMVHHSNNKVDSTLERRMSVIQGVVGAGLHRKLLLGSSNDALKSHSPAIPTATLEFASLCLKNALLILPVSSAKGEQTLEDDVPTQGGSTQQESVFVKALPSNLMKPNEVSNLRASILCCSAYVALCIHDPVPALSHCLDLLSQPNISNAHMYLAKMYMGEALTIMDKIPDAIGHLNPQSVTDVSTSPPQTKPDVEKLEAKGEKSDREADFSDLGSYNSWYPSDASRARSLMQYNLAVVYAMQGQYQKARINLAECVKMIGSPLPAQTYSLRLYLDLIEGHRNMAQVVIKDHFGHVTPNRPDPPYTGVDTASIAR